MKNCSNCKFKPTEFEKFYDEMHYGRCHKRKEDILFFAATHGNDEEWWDMAFCWLWNPTY